MGVVTTVITPTESAILRLYEKGKSPDEIAYMSGFQPEQIRKLLSKYVKETITEDLQIDLRDK